MKNPVLDALDRKKEVAAIIGGALNTHGIQMNVDPNVLHLRETYIAEISSNQSKISNAIYDRMFPPERHGEFYHYTTAESLKGILKEGGLRLCALKKWIGKSAGELDTFAEKHRLKGYLDDTNGRPYLETLAEDLFYISMTRINANNEAKMWQDFSGAGQGARLRLRVSADPTKHNRGDLRGIYYETGKLTLLNEIDEMLAAGGFPPFVAWTTSRIGAFHLPHHYSGENEIRLLCKHYTGISDLRKRDGGHDYWPLPLNNANDVAMIELISIEGGASADRVSIKKAIKASRLKDTLFL